LVAPLEFNKKIQIPIIDKLGFGFFGILLSAVLQ
jgi:hypothetical protein